MLIDDYTAAPAVRAFAEHAVDPAWGYPRPGGQHSMAGEQGPQLGTGTALWILLPFAVAVTRLLRAQIK
jgi:hypothetical protein